MNPLNASFTKHPVTVAEKAHESVGPGFAAMTITDLPLFTLLKGKMRWHEARQTMLAENVANADTAGYRPRDFSPYKGEPHAVSSAPLTLSRTNASHLAAAAFSTDTGARQKVDDFETTPRDNAVVLEEEMMKVAANQMDYQAASTLYERGLRLMKTATGR